MKDLRIDGENVSFAIELTMPACPVRDQMKAHAHWAVLSLPGVTNVEVAMTSKVRGTQSEQKDELIPLLKHVVPVADGKGGRRGEPLLGTGVGSQEQAPRARVHGGAPARAVRVQRLFASVRAVLERKSDWLLAVALDRGRLAE